MLMKMILCRNQACKKVVKCLIKVLLDDIVVLTVLFMLFQTIACY